MPRHVAIALPALALAVALAGCGGADSDTAADSAPAGGYEATTRTGDTDQSGQVSGLTADAGGGGEDAGRGGSAGADPGSAPLGRALVDSSAVVRTATLSVRVDDLRAAADRAGQVARDAGGSVASERADTGRGGTRSDAELVLRVPPESFDDVLARLAGLGEERSRALGVEEVGDQLVDLQSRLASQRASVERVRDLLAQAEDLSEVVKVEAELTSRTAELESLEARLAALQDRVRMSTVTLRLDSDADADPDAAALPGFLDGLSGGWTALLAVGTVLGATVGALLPFAPLALLAGYAAARARRSRARTDGPLDRPLEPSRGAAPGPA